MPSYDYRCAANGQVLEVRHGMNESLKTWGELCERAGTEVGATAADTPVQRVISGGNFVSSRALKNPEQPSCSTGMCGGGMCGL